MLAVGGNDGRIRLLDPRLRSTSVEHVLEAHTGPVQAMAVTPTDGVKVSDDVISDKKFCFVVLFFVEEEGVVWLWCRPRTKRQQQLLDFVLSKFSHLFVFSVVTFVGFDFVFIFLLVLTRCCFCFVVEKNTFMLPNVRLSDILFIYNPLQCWQISPPPPPCPTVHNASLSIKLRSCPWE